MQNLIEKVNICTVCNHMFVLYFIKDMTVYYFPLLEICLCCQWPNPDDHVLQSSVILFSVILLFVFACLHRKMIRSNDWKWALVHSHTLTKKKQEKERKAKSQQSCQLFCFFTVSLCLMSWLRSLFWTEFTAEAVALCFFLWYGVYLAWWRHSQRQTDGSACGRVPSTCSRWHLVMNE